MIQEIINFTKDILADYPELAQQKLKPDNGLYVFIDIDANGKWVNEDMQKGKDYDYYNDKKNTNTPLLQDCIRYQEATTYVTMNKLKAFDSKQKIHSSSPFAVSFNFHFNKNDKDGLGLIEGKKLSSEEKAENEKIIRTKRLALVKGRLKDYQKNSTTIYKLELCDDDADLLLNATPFKYNRQLLAFYENMNRILDKITEIPEYNLLTDKNYLKVFLRSVPIEEQETLYQKYLEDNLLNGDEYKGKGVIGFLTSYSQKKMFISHKTSIAIKGIGYRYSKQDALILNTFEKMWKRKCFPNPLPIVIDKNEINKQIVKIYNENGEAVHYKEILKRLFEKTPVKELSDYYLLNYTNKPDGMVMNDFDFVPLFRYKFDNVINIDNVTKDGFVKNGDYEPTHYEYIENVFDFERIIVKDLFNNSLVKIKDGKYSTKYFDDIEPKYVIGGDIMYQLILKYRKAFYDYIYKSQNEALTCRMFDDIMYNSILSNIRYDEIKTRFEYNNSIKRKINIWFSLYNSFSNNNNNNNIMASKVTELQAKMVAVAKGEANIETKEEFAFGAGQIVSYLIDRSAASNKTYAMLEPYLQKSKSDQLQDAIAQTITVYKHDISVYKGTFENLSSQVLTDDCNADMKPLLKFFLAGCFSPCAVYTKKDNSNN